MVSRVRKDVCFFVFRTLVSSVFSVMLTKDLRMHEGGTVLLTNCKVNMANQSLDSIFDVQTEKSKAI